MLFLCIFLFVCSFFHFVQSVIPCIHNIAERNKTVKNAQHSTVQSIHMLSKRTVKNNAGSQAKTTPDEPGGHRWRNTPSISIVVYWEKFLFWYGGGLSGVWIVLWRSKWKKNTTLSYIHLMFRCMQREKMPSANIISTCECNKVHNIENWHFKGSGQLNIGLFFSLTLENIILRFIHTRSHTETSMICSQSISGFDSVRRYAHLLDIDGQLFP